MLLGRNIGANAVELLLASLGFCYSIGYVANAAARGIEIEEMEYELEATSTCGTSSASRTRSGPASRRSVHTRA